MTHAEVECFECNGTGSTVPDCPLCGGYRSISAKRAYAKGWKKCDLPEVESDGYCECPECYEDASSCMFCYGDGRVSPFIESQQRARVLIAAASPYNAIPHCFHYRDRLVEVDQEIYLLSRTHTAQLREEGMLDWYVSVFGDELRLTQAGKEAARLARQEYRALCRIWIRDERKRRLERQLISIIVNRPRIAEEAF